MTSSLKCGKIYDDRATALKCEDVHIRHGKLPIKIVVNPNIEPSMVLFVSADIKVAGEPEIRDKINDALNTLSTHTDMTIEIEAKRRPKE